MHYKTIVLELLQQYPQLHRELASRKTLLPTLDHFSADLKALHDNWTQTMSRERPESAPSQIASETLELALQELRDALPAASTPNDDSTEPLSLDAATAHIRRHTPPAQRHLAPLRAHLRPPLSSRSLPSRSPSPQTPAIRPRAAVSRKPNMTQWYIRESTPRMWTCNLANHLNTRAKRTARP
jgi:hypothetical protein